MLVALISQHLRWDFVLYLAFFAGQALTVLRRAGIAMRSPTNPVLRRRDYVKNNWDLLLIRTLIEIPFFWAWRHAELQDIFALFGKRVPFEIPQGTIAAFAWGFFADSTLDWLSTVQKIGPWPVPSWLKSNIPSLPMIKSP